MAFSYCPHCGFKNMYSIQAPKFCGGCGQGLSILSAAKTTSSVSKKHLTPNPARRVRRSPELLDESYDPDGSDVYEVPAISKLSYSVEQDKNKFNLKDLIPLEDLDPEKVAPKKPKKRGRPKKA